ncbi:putative acyltransferase-like protein [Rosellinia necatrix]|uniref:Putative acyltransferase-like protein n=1 Tax=Rosellinia necatrix TaxID=77044 RepID=A0A1W2TAF4_ROSNE|nr:putative acyltransferase-like protein [Rosellinia necatrix]
MEKYSQFRDRGSGISPFLPASAPTSMMAKFFGVWIFLFRLPIFATYCAAYFLVLDHLPLPQFLRKLLLWTMLGIPGIWWVDLQLDGVKRGSLSQQPPSRFPRERAVVAAQFTSPVDAVYLAAIFDPIFVVSYPATRKVQRISLFRAMTLALAPPNATAPPSGLTTVRALVEQNPHRVVAVFPEMTTTNGKGILPASPSLLSCPTDAKIFPVSLRYTPPDITTPIPGAWFFFLWNLLSKPTHYIRVRVAEGVSNTTVAVNRLTNRDMSVKPGNGGDGGAEATPEEQQLLDHVGDSLARLARNKRVGLTLQDKAAFVEAWSKGKGKK